LSAAAGGLAMLILGACGSTAKTIHKPTTTAAASSKPASTASSTLTRTSAGTGDGTGSGTTTGSTASANGSTAVARQAYAHDVLGLVNTFQTAARAFQAANASGTTSALASSATAFGRAAAQFAGALGKLTPPANVANAQVKLVAVVQTFAKDLQALGRDAAAKNLSALRRETAAIQGLQPELQAAENAVQK
jgi:hypothetical protein